MRYCDPSGLSFKDVIDVVASFVQGAGAGVIESTTYSLGGNQDDLYWKANQKSYYVGKAFGGALSSAGGTLLGAGGAAFGVVTAPTGVGAVVGGGVAVYGGSIAVSGANVAGESIAMALSSGGNSSGKKKAGGEKNRSIHYRGHREYEADFVYGNELTDHAYRHGKDMGIKDENDYLAAAREFFEKDATDTMEYFYGEDGNFYLYDTATNEFGVINEFGGISSYYLPDRGVAYWLDKMSKLK